MDLLLIHMIFTYKKGDQQKIDYIVVACQQLKGGTRSQLLKNDNFRVRVQHLWGTYIPQGKGT